jgi:hypothetical protein
VGFAGVLLIVQAQSAGFSIYAIVYFASTAIMAVRDIVTRRAVRELPNRVARQVNLADNVRGQRPSAPCCP